jgi:P-type Mg2+ transporter
MAKRTAHGYSSVLAAEARQRLHQLAYLDVSQVLAHLGSSQLGLHAQQVSAQRLVYGDNALPSAKPPSLAARLWRAFVHTFNVLLLILASISFVTDVLLSSYQGQAASYASTLIIISMILIAGVLRFVQEGSSDKMQQQLAEILVNRTQVIRSDGQRIYLDSKDLVVGDIVRVAAGECVAADMIIIESKNLYVSQSRLTGEVMAQHKVSEAASKSVQSLLDLPNVIFMGSQILSGSAKAVVVSTGISTMLGDVSQMAVQERRQSHGVAQMRRVSQLMLRIMLLSVPLVWLVNALVKGSWLEAGFFAVAVGVSLTPEMLPVIIASCMGKSVMQMAKQQVIVKSVEAMQNLGSMQILCLDKSGTLTDGQMQLQCTYDSHAQSSQAVLDLLYLNSYHTAVHHGGFDSAICSYGNELDGDRLKKDAVAAHLQDENSFDFERRRSAVLLRMGVQSTLIVKGEPSSMLAICNYQQDVDGQVVALESSTKVALQSQIDRLAGDGLYVLMIGYRHLEGNYSSCTLADESQLILVGYATFWDAPKPSAKAMIALLKEYGIKSKMLSGDNALVCLSVAKHLGMRSKKILSSRQIEHLDGASLAEVASSYDIFVGLSPVQKAQVVQALRSDGSQVGFMGDGVNDALALRAADVGIGVAGALDIARESSEVLLLQNNLEVVHSSIMAGRVAMANLTKYLKITLSSNFGNLFSLLSASLFLPFLPMMSLQVLVLGLIYDASCALLPWDNVDAPWLERPRQLEGGSLWRFMVWFGPLSSVFDWITFYYIYFYLAPHLVSGGLLYTQIAGDAVVQEGMFAGMSMKVAYVALFQSCWFVQSMWTQSLVIQLLRSPHLVFVKTRCSLPVAIGSLLGIGLITMLPYASFAHRLGFVAIPQSFYAFLLINVSLYMLAVSLVKSIYIRRYQQFL